MTKPEVRSDDPSATSELDLIQQESQSQALPEQRKVFEAAPRIRSKLHNLPDPTRPPLGFTPDKGFDEVFPFIKLPALTPDLNGDWVQFGSPELEPNRLYYGDNLHVLRTLPSNSIDLIYIDPPFFSGAEYNVIWGDDNEVRTFSDIWEGGLDTYLIWLNARLWEMCRVLKPTGSIYVHCDWHASHYIKQEADSIFGYKNFRNGIVWYYRRYTAASNSFQRLHDTILWYTKGSKWTFEEQREPYTEKSGTMDSHYKQDEQGQWSRLQKRAGQEPYRVYLNEEGKRLGDVWEIQHINASAKERIGYPTQKPEALLERIIDASTREGQVVADFFCGGGTTPAVAQKLGRKWIACDSSRIAISVTLNRLVGICEERSGVKSNYSRVGEPIHQLKLAFAAIKVPDIRVHYVGVYPMDRFKAVDQAEFEKFALGCLGAQADNSEYPITGWRGPREPLRVGPGDPDAAPDPKDLQAFFQACLKHLKENVRLNARYVCWRTPPDFVAYRKRLLDYVRTHVQPKGADLDLEFLLIGSESFRERVRHKYPDAGDSEFLLRFTKPPVVGGIAARRIGPLQYRFETPDAASTNTGGDLVNCQWDFDYQRGHFSADRDCVLCRQELTKKEAKAKGRKFEAVLSAEYTFPSAGQRTVACRVQDNLGAEAVGTITLEVEG